MSLSDLKSSRPGTAQRPSAPRLLFVVTEDWYFLMHRLPMALAAQAAGFEVHLATRVVNGGEAIDAGLYVHPIEFVRGRAAPLASPRTIAELRRLHRSLNPAVTHHVSLQTIVLGSIAAIGRPTARVNALDRSRARLRFQRSAVTRPAVLIGAVLRILFNRRGAVALVENPDDGRTPGGARRRSRTASC